MSASHTRVAYADQPAPVFARVYAHAGMVGLGGEKMSKSLGNLVFVSRLVADGEDPMAVRLALLAHHYRDDWEWTEPGLAAARTRLTRWRTATDSAGAPAPATPPAPGVTPVESVLARVRERLADDLDAPGALTVVDRWAEAAIADPAAVSPADRQLVRDLTDALLGVAL
jgi:L-cysteine:1D-myo-inositol 2-amino-2-deoxy-alpha-D-glucopyranoside ligase